ncbi:cellulose binding domain-containing protein [Actinomadura sp. GTD37]|uniref:cellulose binding domain-containing protein n=1 Tax=Actinomadura sp. GTD37 TaxID=1778030 RepID=UPI0035BF1854
MRARLKSCAVLAAALPAIPLYRAAPASAATQLCGATDTVPVAGGEHIAPQGGAGLATDAFGVQVGGTTTPPTDPPPSEGGCTAALRTDNAWNGGFTATVTVTNYGDAPLSGWSADWTFSGGQRVSNGWNAAVTQTGPSVHAVDAGYNGAVAAHGSTSFGFQGTGSAPGAPDIASGARDIACAAR